MGGTDEATADGRHPLMADNIEEPVFALAVDCGRQFEKILKIEETAKSANTKRFLEEYQRLFWTWAQYVGVFAAGKASLDWRLRRNNESRDLFLLALDMLRVNLLQRKYPARNFNQICGRSDVLKVLPLDASSVDSVDSDSFDDSDPHGVAFEGIEESISQLNNLGIYIRQPSTSRLESKVKAFASKRVDQLNDFEILALIAVERLYPNAAPSLRRRLGKHMVDIHARLLYWKSHAKKLGADRGGPPDKQTEPNPLSIKSSPTNSVHNVLGDKDRRQPAATFTETEATTVPHQHPDPTRGRQGEPKTSRVGEAPTVLTSKVELPPPPGAEDGYVCWYCRKVHSAEEYDDDNWWR